MFAEEMILDGFFAGRTPRISEPPEEVKKYEPMRLKILGRLEEKGIGGRETFCVTRTPGDACASAVGRIVAD
jgi:hypothetical protein